ncbi:MAG TPA: sulfotransferase [Mycobacterium sp.]|nr:sulfotransferase [Mycobacterium sp.]HPZ93892.1 sulfotransferase [Mycobacterium sp.]HQE15452.1 sulfotransferase [Mycobacterium sp.]
MFDNYYADCPAEVIFDTSRAWCGWMPAIARLFPEAKVIACVRDVSWVVGSIEKLAQRNVFSPSSIFNYSAGGTVYTRANAIVAADGLVGGPYDALKQACYGAQRDRLLLVQYESLTADPGMTLRAIYDFLGEPWFEHDFKPDRLRRLRIRRVRRYAWTAYGSRPGQGRVSRNLAAARAFQSVHPRRILA